MWRNAKNSRLGRTARLAWSFLLLILVGLSGCAQPTASQVAGPHAPPDLQSGPTPPGGPSADITGGGSAAAGVEAGRVGGIEPRPVAPAYPPGRMAPSEASGSGAGDRGYAVSPDQSPVYPDLPSPTTRTLH